MNNFRKILFAALSVLMVFTLTAAAVFAEPEEETGADTSAETSEGTGAETSTETSGETSGETSEDPDKVFKVSIKKGAGDVLCYFNGSEEAKSEYVGNADEHVTVKIVPKENTVLKEVFLATIFKKEINGEGICEFGIDASIGFEYKIDVTVEKMAPPAEKVSLSVDTLGIDGVTVNGEAYTEKVSFDAGTELTLAFGSADSFDASKARLFVNGTLCKMTGNTYTFKIEKNTEVFLKYNIVTVSFTVKGHGTVTVNGKAYRNRNDEERKESIDLAMGESLKYIITPEKDYAITAYDVRPVNIPYQNGGYFVEALDTDIEFSVVFEYTGGSVEEKMYDITISVGENGTVTLDGKTVTGAYNCSKKAGESLTFTIIPDTGYELDFLKVGKEVQNVENNTFTLSNIATDNDIIIKFKETATPPIDTDQPISIKDIDWNSGNIVIDITKQTKVSSEVFDKIASLKSSGVQKYVEFRGVNCVWYVPYGGKINCQNSEFGDMNVNKLTSGPVKEKVDAAIKKRTEANISYGLFEFKNGLNFPKGTMISLNMGMIFKEMQNVLLVFNETNGAITDKPDADKALPVGTNGWSSKYPYDNEKYLICSKNIKSEYTVTVNYSAGGLVNPSGVNTVKFNEDSAYTISANEGFVIGKLIVDGEEQQDACNKSIYVYTFSKVCEDHTIEVEFRQSADAQNGDSSSEEEKGGNTTLIVTLVIIFVAVAGAAALFIVKWRQEKF